MPGSVGGRKAAYWLPRQAAEILSVAASPVREFFGHTKNGEVVHFEWMFAQLAGVAGTEEFPTRAGYVHKIVMALLVAEPAPYIQFMLSEQWVWQLLALNCSSRACHDLLAAKLLLRGTSPGLAALRGSTVASRRGVFLAICRLLPPLSDDACAAETRDALAGLVASVLTSESDLRAQYLEDFAAEVAPGLLERALAPDTASPRRLLELLAAAAAADSELLLCFARAATTVIANPRDPMRGLQLAADDLFLPSDEAPSPPPPVDELQLDPPSLETRRAATSGGGAPACDPRLPALLRVLETALLVTEKSLCLLKYPGLVEGIFDLFSLHPHNNFLHSQLLALCKVVLRLKDETLRVFFFTSKEGLPRLAAQLADQHLLMRSNSKAKNRPSFLGHLIILTSLILKDARLSAELEASPDFQSYLAKVYTPELQLANLTIGEPLTLPPEFSSDYFRFASIQSALNAFKNFVEIKNEDLAVEGAQSKVADPSELDLKKFSKQIIDIQVDELEE